MINEFKKADREAVFDRARDRDPVLFDRIMSTLSVKGCFDCWETTRSRATGGYAHIRVNGKKQRVHKLMYNLFYPDNSQPVVRHLCNNPACSNIIHLRAGTQLDNARDRKFSGREGNHKGEVNGRSKLTEEAVRDIRSSGLSGRKLADKYGVSKAVISCVKLRKSWKHI